MSSSLKPLKSVAHNVCHQFASTLNYWAGDYGINHFARSVVAAGNLVVVDLLASTSCPALAGEGAMGVQQLAAALPSLLVKEGFEPNLLASATATYHIRGPLPKPGGNVAYDCRVSLTRATEIDAAISRMGGAVGDTHQRDPSDAAMMGWLRDHA